MTALTDNQIVNIKQQPLRLKLKVVDGAIRIYKGALLQYENSNIGYVMLAADTATASAQGEFAGIALEEKNLAAADNTADGTYDVEVIARGSNECVELNVTSTITIANEGDAVYMDDDGAVDLASGISNTTGGLVGIIRQYISANKALVQLVPHPNV